MYKILDTFGKLSAEVPQPKYMHIPNKYFVELFVRPHLGLYVDWIKSVLFIYPTFTKYSETLKYSFVSNFPKYPNQIFKY